MKKWKTKIDLNDDQRVLRAHLVERVKSLTASEAKVVLRFIDELVVCYDPDVIHDFLQWREDPRLASLLQLGARLSEDMRDQLLFHAEDLFASEQTRQ
ncbi:MAG: hypothetical protein QNJ20_12575 [Paracoccaceae bacterium]|nr:hypothetical protein [Paracoccaceae bacterium]